MVTDSNPENAEAVVALIEFVKMRRYKVGMIQQTGARTNAIGSAFHGSTRSDKPTLEKPPLKVLSGVTAMAPAVTYGRKRQDDIARTPPNVAGAGHGVSTCAGDLVTVAGCFGFVSKGRCNAAAA